MSGKNGGKNCGLGTHGVAWVVEAAADGTVAARIPPPRLWRLPPPPIRQERLPHPPITVPAKHGATCPPPHLQTVRGNCRALSLQKRLERTTDQDHGVHRVIRPGIPVSPADLSITNSTRRTSVARISVSPGTRGRGSAAAHRRDSHLTSQNFSFATHVDRPGGNARSAGIRAIVRRISACAATASSSVTMPASGGGRDGPNGPRSSLHGSPGASRARASFSPSVSA